jgi:MFS transporter, DHA1 family, solute carrier family 18 (vesicular amine transporter), member 1/2
LPDVTPAEIRLAALVATIAFVDIAVWLTVVPLIPYWEQELGLSHRQSGVVLGSYGLAVLLLAIPAGHLADRLGPRRMTIAAVLLFAVTTPLYAVASNFGELLALRVAGGLFSAVSWTAGLAWLVASTPETHRGRALATVNASASAGSLAGPLIGGPIVAGLGLGPAMIALGSIVGALAIWALVEPNRERHVPGAPTSPRAVFAAARRERGLADAFAGIFFAASAMGSLQILGPLYLDGEGWSSADIGWVWTIGAAISLAVAALVGRSLDRLDKRRTARFGVAAVSVLCCLLALSPAAVTFTIGVIAILGVGTVIWTSVFPLCSEAAERAGIGQGAALGMLNGVWALATVMAPIAAGLLAGADLAGVGYIATAALGAVVILALRPAALARVDTST